MKLNPTKCPCGCSKVILEPLCGCQCSSVYPDEAREVTVRVNMHEKLVSALEKLVLRPKDSRARTAAALVLQEVNDMKRSPFLCGG